MGYHVTQVWIGSRKVGIAGLEEIFADVRAFALTDEESIRAEIIRRVRQANYVPADSEAEYGRALLLAYRRFLGENIPEEQEILEIRVYGGN